MAKKHWEVGDWVWTCDFYNHSVKQLQIVQILKKKCMGLITILYVLSNGRIEAPHMIADTYDEAADLLCFKSMKAKEETHGKQTSRFLDSSAGSAGVPRTRKKSGKLANGSARVSGVQKKRKTNGRRNG